jgi:hypothetical protein
VLPHAPRQLIGGDACGHLVLLLARVELVDLTQVVEEMSLLPATDLLWRGEVEDRGCSIAKDCALVDRRKVARAPHRSSALRGAPPAGSSHAVGGEVLTLASQTVGHPAPKTRVRSKDIDQTSSGYIAGAWTKLSV